MESSDHRAQMNVLCDTLDLHWKDRTDYYVGGNQPLYFSAAQVLKNDFLGPDVMVILDTVRRPRKSWVVWQEGRTPDVIIELLSPSTEDNDRGAKMMVYARTLRVPEYYLYDPIDGRFEGYALQPNQGLYVARTLEDDGGLTSTCLGLRLAPYDQHQLATGERRTYLRWFTLDGELVPTEGELRAKAEARAEAERSRAEALAARLRALGIDPEA